MITFLPLGFHYYGILGVILVIACNDIPFYLSVAYGLSTLKMTAFKQDIMFTLFLLFSVASVSSLRFVLGYGFSVDKIVNF
jgi:hypothetical protein